MATVTEPRIESPPLETLHDIRTALGLSQEKMAYVFDVSAKTIQRWEQSGALPRSDRQLALLTQLREIAELAHIVYTPKGVALFMRTPLPVFDGRTALHLLHLGEGNRVFGSLAMTYEGGLGA